MTKKPTREILTKQKLAKELAFHVKASFPPVIVACFVSLIIAFLFFTGLPELFGKGIVKTAFAVFIAAIALLVPCVTFYMLYSLFKQRSDIEKGNFTVVKDILSRKVKDEVRRRGRHTYIEDVFYFYEHGRYVVTKSDGSAFEYSDEHDEFYLVFIEGNKKGSPQLVYNAKIYEYNEK